VWIVRWDVLLAGALAGFHKEWSMDLQIITLRKIGEGALSIEGCQVNAYGYIKHAPVSQARGRVRWIIDRVQYWSPVCVWALGGSEHVVNGCYSHTH